MNSELLTQFTENMETVPASFNNWKSEDSPLSPEEFERTDCTAYVSRNYTNTSTAKQVSVYSVVGTARHVTIHSPDWCYVGAGFTMENQPQPYIIQIDGENHEFTTATFSKNSNEGLKRLRIFWSYTEDGTWHGPSSPKSYFAGKPALCKVYLITSISPDDKDIDGDPSIGFAKEFMPLITKELLRPLPESTSTEA